MEEDNRMTIPKPITELTVDLFILSINTMHGIEQRRVEERGAEQRREEGSREEEKEQRSKRREEQRRKRRGERGTF